MRTARRAGEVWAGRPVIGQEPPGAPSRGKGAGDTHPPTRKDRPAPATPPLFPAAPGVPAQGSGVLCAMAAGGEIGKDTPEAAAVLLSNLRNPDQDPPRS